MEQLYSIVTSKRQCFTTKRFSNGVSSLFFIPSKLAEGIKREGREICLRVFPTIFQLSFYLPTADRNPFLARDQTRKTENFMEWSSAFHRCRYSSLPPSPSYGFLPSFFFRVCRRYDLLPNDRVSFIHVDHYSCFWE